LIFQKIISDGRKNPYSFSRLFEELTGRPFKNRPIFQPPTLTPLRKAIAESTVGIFKSCGAQLLLIFQRPSKRGTSYFFSEISMDARVDSQSSLIAQLGSV
jgi:hypothetical protein